jgi:hypothetical protein
MTCCMSRCACVYMCVCMYIHVCKCIICGAYGLTLEDPDDLLHELVCMYVYVCMYVCMFMLARQNE